MPAPTGSKTTIRQSMILVVWASLLTAGTRLLIRYRRLGDRPEIICLNMGSIFAIYPLPLLAGLLWLLDRSRTVSR